MVNKKVMLAKSVGETPPEAGYWPAKLTIGYFDKMGYYGYDSELGFGNLNPTGNVKFIIVIRFKDGDCFTNCGDKNGKTFAFYYKGRKYKEINGVTDLFNEWKSMLGKTVDVWIEGAAGGLKRFLHRLFAILCGGLCYAEQRATSNSWKAFCGYATHRKSNHSRYRCRANLRRGVYSSERRKSENSLRLSGFDQGSYSLLHGKSKHREVAFRGVQNYRPYKGSLSESVSIANKEALYA